MSNVINDTDEEKKYLLDDDDYDIFDAKGNDIYFLGNGNNTITDFAGNDAYVAGNGTNLIKDGYGHDTYMTGNGDYTIYVGYGNNTFYLGDGSHQIMDLQDGDNTYYLSNGEYLIQDSRGDSTFYLGNEFNYIHDAYGQDTYYLNNGINIIYGGYGNDTYYMGEGINFIFNNNVETLYDGDDTFYAGSSADYMDGGFMQDSVYYINSNEAVYVDLANNIASGGYAEGDTLIRIENIVGSDLSDQRDFLYGNASRNYLYGLAGDDVLEGGGWSWSGQGDYLDGGDGWDYARYTRSSSAVHINMETGVHTGGDAEGDTLVNIEAITGSAHNDTMIGNDDHNYFYAGNGDDVFIGGLGRDQFWGQGGADTMKFVDDSAFERRDLFRDFNASEGDALDISAILEGYDALSDAIADFVQVTDNGTNTFVAVDADGGADNFITIVELYNIIGLTAEDMEVNGNLITTV